ncbi:MAG: hypothetical protein R2684_17140 [Pyrinomonadaceae bacterium]
MRTLLTTVILASFLLYSACFGEEETAKNSNSEAASSPLAKNDNVATPSEANKPGLESSVTTPTPVKRVEAVTLKPLIESYCKARREKNEAAIRKLYSAASVRDLEAKAREDGEASIVEYLEVEPVGSKCAVYNERVAGNVGEALVVTESYPNGSSWKFVKENGEWKMTNQSSDFDKVKAAAKNQ